MDAILQSIVDKTNNESGMDYRIKILIHSMFTFICIILRLCLFIPYRFGNTWFIAYVIFEMLCLDFSRAVDEVHPLSLSIWQWNPITLFFQSLGFTIVMLIGIHIQTEGIVGAILLYGIATFILKWFPNTGMTDNWVYWPLSIISTLMLVLDYRKPL